jgi:hypothetical protein
VFDEINSLAQISSETICDKKCNTQERIELRLGWVITAPIIELTASKVLTWFVGFGAIGKLLSVLVWSNKKSTWDISSFRLAGWCKWIQLEMLLLQLRWMVVVGNRSLESLFAVLDSSEKEFLQRSDTPAQQRHPPTEVALYWQNTRSCASIVYRCTPLQASVLTGHDWAWSWALQSWRTLVGPAVTRSMHSVIHTHKCGLDRTPSNARRPIYSNHSQGFPKRQ